LSPRPETRAFSSSSARRGAVAGDHEAHLRVGPHDALGRAEEVHEPLLLRDHHGRAHEELVLRDAELGADLGDRARVSREAFAVDPVVDDGHSVAEADAARERALEIVGDGDHAIGELHVVAEARDVGVARAVDLVVLRVDDLRARKDEARREPAEHERREVVGMDDADPVREEEPRHRREHGRIERKRPDLLRIGLVEDEHALPREGHVGEEPARSVDAHRERPKTRRIEAAEQPEHDLLQAADVEVVHHERNGNRHDRSARPRSRASPGVRCRDRRRRPTSSRARTRGPRALRVRLSPPGP
jgi:hypothetical protein